MRPIFLIGFMCSGKTTLGEALAGVARLRFIDLDEEVERKAGKSVRQIFADHGEEEFRRLEQEALRRCALSRDTIIACGGGTPCRPGAMDIMNAHGLTVRLEADRPVLIRRLMEGRHKRPLLATIASEAEMGRFVDTAMAKREPFYSLAAETFDSSRLETAQQIADSVADFRARFMDNM